MKNKILLIILIFFNFFATIAAFISYLDRFPQHPILFWPFIPISALCFGLGTACFILITLKKKIPSLLSSFSFFCLFTYGVVCSFLYSILMIEGGFSWAYFFCLITHIIFVFEAFLLTKYANNVKLIDFAIILIYFGITDYLHVYKGTTVYLSGLLSATAILFTIILTLTMQLISLIILIYYKLMFKK